MLKSRRSAVAFAAAFLAAHGAFAFEGRYIAGDKAHRQELEIKTRADGGFDLTAVVGTEGCSGYVDARGAANGDTLRAEALEGQDLCSRDQPHEKGRQSPTGELRVLSWAVVRL